MARSRRESQRWVLAGYGRVPKYAVMAHSTLGTIELCMPTDGAMSSLRGIRSPPTSPSIIFAADRPVSIRHTWSPSLARLIHCEDRVRRQRTRSRVIVRLAIPTTFSTHIASRMAIGFAVVATRSRKRNVRGVAVKEHKYDGHNRRPGIARYWRQVRHRRWRRRMRRWLMECAREWT